MPPFTIDPRHAALLVMDYQNGTVAQVDESLLGRAAQAIAHVRGRGGTVGYVRVAFTDDDYAAIPETSQFAAVLTPERRAMLHVDSPHSAIAEKVAPEPGDLIVRKTRVGAFSTTDLDDQLRKAGITTLILAGIATSGVVLSTVREAADRDYRLVVLADACADSKQSVHDCLVEDVFPRQAQVMPTAELPELFS